jgi:phytoene desaturase
MHGLQPVRAGLPGVRYYLLRCGRIESGAVYRLFDLRTFLSIKRHFGEKGNTMSRKNKTDIVVIGAGLGGILTAALLARDGYRVTVLEKLTFPGGRYTTLEKNGYKINTGAWAVGLHGTNGPLYQLMAELGAEIETRVPGPDHIHLWVQGRDEVLPTRGQLGHIVDLVSRDDKESERVMKATRQALKWQEPSDEISIDQWLYQYTDNPLIHGQFNFFSRAMTATYYDRFPAGEYFRLMRGFGRFGNMTAMPKNGQKTTIEALLGLLEKWGVELLLETEVEKIVSTDGKVEGVLAESALKGRLEIETSIVVSDAGPKATVHMADPNLFDDGYRRDIDLLEPTKAVVTIFGYERPILDYQSHIQFIEPDRLGTAWEPCHIWPEYAPPGKNCLYTYSTMKTDDTEKELDIIIEQCKEQFPALDKAEVVATLVFKDDWPILRARPTRTLNVKTPIFGLYLAGDGVNVSGWTCGEGISFTCRAIAEDIGNRLAPA